MSAESFEKNSIGWQLSQLQKRSQEWWELQSQQLANNIDDIPGVNWNWLDGEFVELIFKVLFWLIFALLLLWGIGKLIVFLNQYFTIKNRPKNILKHNKKIAKNLKVSTWLTKANEFKQIGNFTDACLCLYMAMLQTLHDRNIAIHQFSRTDGEYLKLIQKLPQSQPYQTLLMTHQRLCFSKTKATNSLFEECYRAYQEIETQKI